MQLLADIRRQKAFGRFKDYLFNKEKEKKADVKYKSLPTGICQRAAVITVAYGVGKVTLQCMLAGASIPIYR